MNAELGKISTDEAPEALDIIATNTRSGGEFIQRLARFANATDFAPQGTASLAEAIDLAHRLSASKARRSGVVLQTAMTSDLPPIAVDVTGLGLCLALMIYSLSDAKARSIQIDTSVAGGTQTVSVLHDGVQPDDELAYRFARQIAEDHGGGFLLDKQSCSISLPT